MPSYTDTNDSLQRQRERIVMGKETLTVAGRYLEAWCRLDPEAMLAELAEDVVMEFPVAPGDIPRRFEGKTAFAGMVRPMTGHFAPGSAGKLNALRAEADDERAVAEYTFEGHTADGRPYTNTYVNLLRVRNGKIVESKEFFDAVAVAQMRAGR
jgi:ketosteroid isomerase-like protein